MQTKKETTARGSFNESSTSFHKTDTGRFRRPGAHIQSAGRLDSAGLGQGQKKFTALRISVAKLLEMARINPETTHVSFSGPEGTREKSERFSMGDILSGKVFLAYRVNDQVLSRKHGFPLRVVAEGFYGGHWLKYVYKITAHKA